MERQNYNYIVIASGLLAYNVVHHVDVCQCLPMSARGRLSQNVMIIGTSELTQVF